VPITITFTLHSILSERKLEKTAEYCAIKSFIFNIGRIRFSARITAILSAVVRDFSPPLQKNARTVI
jgi:hypothetical protein